MIERSHPALSVGAQCRLLSISRLSFYCAPQGETEMKRFDAAGYKGLLIDLYGFDDELRDARNLAREERERVPERSVESMKGMAARAHPADHGREREPAHDPGHGPGRVGHGACRHSFLILIRPLVTSA